MIEAMTPDMTHPFNGQSALTYMLDNQLAGITAVHQYLLQFAPPSYIKEEIQSAIHEADCGDFATQAGVDALASKWDVDVG